MSGPSPSAPWRPSVQELGAARQLACVLVGGGRAEAVLTWWSSQRSRDESLLRFLAREGVVREDAETRAASDPAALERREDLLAGREGRRILLRVLAAWMSGLPDEPLTPVRAQARPLSPAAERGAPPPPRLPRIGERLGNKLLITQRIAAGSSCVVYRALHTSLRAPVAVKVFRPDAVSQGLRTDEARLLAQLDHPHILRVIDLEERGPFPYLVLEHVDGLSLAELIQQSGFIRPHLAARLTISIAEALAHALTKGVLHRDLKPGNILIGREGTPHLADLGTAALLPTWTGNLELRDDDPETVQGTLPYMAPERLLGDAPDDARTDIYSLGATVYQMLTGEPPRGELEDASSTGLTRYLRAPIVPPESLVPSLPPALGRDVLRLLAQDPQQRPRDYAEVIALFQPWSDPSSAEYELAPTPAGSFWSYLVTAFSGQRRRGAVRAPRR